jgi:hypothetical protein
MAETMIGYLGLDGYAGRRYRKVEVVGETPKRYRIRAIERTKLAGRSRWLYPGETALVPKYAVQLADDEADREWAEALATETGSDELC